MLFRNEGLREVKNFLWFEIINPAAQTEV